MRRGPFRPSKMLEFLRGYNATPDEEWFIRLMEKHISPGDRDAVLESSNGWERIIAFGNLFEKENFPLDTDYLESMAEWAMEEEPEDDEDPRDSAYWLLRCGIPFRLMGFDWEDLHELWGGIRPGMSALVMMGKVPDTGSAYANDEYRGMWNAWLEAAEMHISRETLELLPPGGFPMEQLEAALQNTPLEPVCMDIRWMHNGTGNFMLDYSIHDESFTGFYDAWDDELVAESREVWEEARNVIRRTTELEEWLEEDLAVRFRQVLEFTLERIASLPERAGGDDGRTTNDRRQQPPRQVGQSEDIGDTPGPAEAPTGDLRGEHAAPGT